MSIIHQNNLFLGFVAFFGVLLYSLTYPALNWPDEAYKIENLYHSSNPYLSLLNRVKGEACLPSYTLSPDSYFGSNILSIRIISGVDCYYRIKMVNMVFIIIISILCLIILRSTERKNLFLLSLIWPASVFYLTGINQHAVFHLVSITISILILDGRRILPYLLFSIALLFIDRSFVSLVVFLGFVMAIRWQPKFALLSFILLLFLIEFTRDFIGQMTFFFAPDLLISDITNSVSHLGDNWIVSFSILAASMVYLGGTATVLGFGPEYFLVGGVIVYQILKNHKNSEMMVFLLAGTLTFITVVSFVPTLQSFRYYIFMTPMLIHFFIHTYRGKQIFFTYSAVMQLAYLAQVKYINE